MALGKLSKFVTKYPFQSIVIIIVVTALLGSMFMLFGAEMEVSQDTFLPDSELANAYNEISSDYASSSNPVQVLVIGTDGDVLTRDSLLEMLEIQKAIIEDDEIGPTLATPDNPSESVSSVADIIVLGNMVLDAREQFLDMLGPLAQVFEYLSFDGYNTLFLGLNSSVSSSLAILQSDAAPVVKESASTIILNQIELMSLASSLDMGQTDMSSTGSMGSITNLVIILASPASNDVKGNATHMVLSQMELAALAGSQTGGAGLEQMAAIAAMLGPLNDTLSSPSLSYDEKQLAVGGTIDILTAQIGQTQDELAVGFMMNLRGSLYDLFYILDSASPDMVKDSAIAIMTGEIASFSAPPSSSPPDESFTALMENFGSTLTSLYTILSMETDQTITGNAVNMVVNGFSLIETPVDAGGSIEFQDLGALMGSGDMFSITTDIDSKIAYLENNMTGSSVKDTLQSMFEFNATDDELIDNTILAVNNNIVELDSISSSLTGLIGNLFILENSLTDQTDSVTVKYFSAGLTETLVTMGGTAQVMQLLEDGLEAGSMMDGMIQGLAFSMPLMLTSDFTTDNMAANGTMMIVLLDATSIPGETEEQQQDRLLLLEKKIVQIVGDEGYPFTDMSVMGMLLIEDEIMTASMDSMNILLPAAGILVLVILSLIFQNLLEIFLNILALIFAIVWVFGLGTVFGFAFNPMTIAVPVLLVGLGIDYGIHLTLRYKEEKGRGNKPVLASRNTIISVGSALLLATTATVIGFLSNIGSDMSVLREFSILCAIGIFSSFIIMVTFIPACKQLVDTRKEKKAETSKNQKKNNNKNGATKWGAVKGSGVSAVNRGLGFGAVAAEHHPVAVIIVILLITSASAVAATGLSTEFNFEDFLPGDMEITQTIVYLSDNFNSSLMETADILVKGDIASHELLTAINQTTSNMVDDTYVLKTYGRWGEQADASTILTLMWDVAEDRTATNPLDIFSPTFQSMFSDSDTDGDWIPDTNIEALYAWLYTNETTQRSATNYLHRADGGGFDGTVIRINVNTEGETKSGELYDELEDDIAPLTALIADNSISQASITGMSILTYVLITELTDSMYQSVIITMVLCFIVLTAVFYYTNRSIVIGTITTIPVILCMLWIMGSMYFLGIPFSILTVSVSALTVGLGITYGIHITHRFLEDLQHFNDVEEASINTIRHTGSALFGAAVTTIAGFGLLVFSLLPPIQQFGGIIALTILYCFLASVFVLPTFLVLWAKYNMKKG